MTKQLADFLAAAMHKSQIIPTTDIKIRGLARRDMREQAERIRKRQGSTADLRELRLRDNYTDILAIAWDDLGNALVLRTTGRTQYLVGDEVNGLPY